jgi:aubergine-like protein
VSGTPIQLEANYFKLQKLPQFDFIAYRVDYQPDLESTFQKKRLLQPHMREYALWVFDGTQLFMPCRITPDPRTIKTRNDDDTIVTITIRQVGVISMTDNRALQVFNLITRKASEALNLKMIGRNYFDPSQTVRTVIFSKETITNFRHIFFKVLKGNLIYVFNTSLQL